MVTAAIITCAVLMSGNKPQAIDYVASCRQEVQGMRILVGSTIKAHRPALHPKLNALDFRAFCPCYHGSLRKNLGRDLYVRSRSLGGVSAMSDAETMRVNDQDRAAIIACVEAQLAGRTVASNELRYERFIRSRVTPGAGVGGLKPGDDRNAMFRVLGPTKTFRATPDGGEEYYYGPHTMEVVISLSSSGKVRGITLSDRFRGQTPGGGRIGDSRNRIKQTYRGKLAVDAAEYLVYCDGTTFIFRNGRLDSIRLSELSFDFFERARRASCPRKT